MNGKLLILVSALLLLAAPVQAADDTKPGVVVVGQSRPIISRGNFSQRYLEMVEVKPGMQALPMIMDFQNGGRRLPAFSKFTLSIGGRTIANQDDFRGEQLLRKDLTGQLAPGRHEFLFVGSGPKGAGFSWKLSATAASLSHVKPNEAKPGDRVVLHGANFAPAKEDNIVMFEGTKVEVLKADPKTLEVFVPKNLQTKEPKVTVTVNGNQTNAVSMTIKSAEPPEVSGVSLVSAFSGMPVTISGKNFDPDKAKNIVKFGDLTAPVLSGSTTNLEVIIPEMESPQWYVPISVTIDGQKSTGNVTINVQRRVF